MSKILDEDKKISHDKLAEKVSGILDNERFWNKNKISSTFDTTSLDWAINPVIQSGGDYDLTFQKEPTDRNLHSGVIVAGLGIRYNTYASFVARTYLVDPSKTQESNYKTLLNAHNAAIKSIKDGVTCKEVYNKTLAQIKSKDEKLADHFVKTIGFGVGIETQDSTLILGPKSSATLKDGMTLIVTTGLTNLENKDGQDKRSKNYSLVLSDTIRVTAGEPAVFTKDAASDTQTIAFFFEGDEEPSPKKNASSRRDNRIGAVAQTNITSTRLRNERQQNHDAEKEQKRRGHQKEIAERNLKAGQDKYRKGGKGLNGSEEKRFKRFESYRREDEIPNKVKDLGIVLDTKNSTILLPIMGRPVPFHVNTIKNASTSAEGDFTSLRINFLSPGQGVGRKDDLPFEDPNAQFVRSLTYRSKDSSRMEHVATQLTDLKKNVVRREQEKKQMEDVVEQDKLILDRRGQELDNVFLRPTFDSKRIAGKVQIHQNGIRYSHGAGLDRSTQVDVLFNNVKHFLFQPTKGELIVLIHFHLINPILIGKKKTRDVQFFREASDIQFDETGVRKRKHRHGDEDEFEAEQQERRRRQELDRLFSSFARKIEEAGRDTNLKVDVPKRELGFFGVPSRSNVLVQPTPYCLVQLTESPFMVITLEDIEIVHLERVAVSRIISLRSWY
jgi:nucleosome binding factor SPN SPT16 subunit